MTWRISQGGTAAYSDFWYGPGRERIQQTAKKSASVTETTLYVGGAYEKVTRGATTEHVHYIRGGGDVVAIQKKIAGGSTETRYLHRDHLGSVVAATDYLGNVIERYSFDPWGKRRDPGTWLTPSPGTFSHDPAFNDRGYTGHEHIDHLGLVNMNGRVYDPELGRFLSADPFVQFPESTQGYNRYTYVGNNPLSYTDPSGFFSFKDFLKIAAIATISWFTGGAATAWLSGNTLNAFLTGTMVNVSAGAMAGGAFFGGFVGGFLGSGGDLRTGLISGLGAALASGIGSEFSGASLTKTPLKFLAKALTHGAVQGAVSEALGGEFKDGLLGGFAGSVFEPLAAAIESGTDSAIVATMATAVIGGTVSVIGGGKFANGATSAAFVDLFNRRGHREAANRTTLEERLAQLKPGTDYQAEFNQSTGDFTIYAADGSVELLQLGGLNFSWSGYDGYINDPSANFLEDFGPTPRGLWTIGGPRVFKGMQSSFHLSPVEGANTVYWGSRKPNSFWIHGANVANPALTSQGCIVLPLTVRQALASSGAKVLYVHR